MTFNLNRLRDEISKLRDSKLFAPIFTWYDALPAEQKQIANVGAIGGMVLILLVIVFMGHRKVGALKEEIETKNLNLKELRRYEAKFDEQSQTLKQLEREAKQISADFSLLSALEQLAQSSQIGRESIESISPKQLAPGDFFVETEATVQLVKVTLRQLVDYFYRVESSPTHMVLKELKVKPRFDNPQFLNVTFKVSAFKPKD